MTTDKGITKAEYLRLSQSGEALLQQGHAAEAEQLFRELAKRLEKDASYDSAYDHVVTLARLGRCLWAEGQPTQAIQWPRKALRELDQFAVKDNTVKKLMAACHVDWANSLNDIGLFDEAQEHYETALPILHEIDAYGDAGATLNQLGTLATERGDLTLAAKRYSEALNIFRAIDEPQSEAVVWHQLGMMAQEAKQWDKAERCYRESLRLEERMNNSEGVARVSNQIAEVYHEAGRLYDAERWYKQSLETIEQVGIQRYIGNTAKLTWAHCPTGAFSNDAPNP